MLLEVKIFYAAIKVTYLCRLILHNPQLCLLAFFFFFFDFEILFLHYISSCVCLPPKIRKLEQKVIVRNIKPSNNIEQYKIIIITQK